MNSEQINQALKQVMLVGLAGRPGAGKEFTGDALLHCRCTTYTRIIMSDLINRETKRGSTHGMLVKQYLDSGNLVPDDLVVDLFLNEVASLHAEGCRTILCDGFPRTNIQQDILDERNARFVMFFIEIDIELAIERMLKRGRSGETRDVCIHRQNVYQTHTMPMIERFRARHPTRFIQIDGSKANNADTIHKEIENLKQKVLT